MAWEMNDWLLSIACVHGRVHVINSEILNDLALPRNNAALIEFVRANRMVI